jgi:hypothetical protein
MRVRKNAHNTECSQFLFVGGMYEFEGKIIEVKYWSTLGGEKFYVQQDTCWKYTERWLISPYKYVNEEEVCEAQEENGTRV